MRWRFTAQKPQVKPGPSSQPSAVHRAPNAAERSQVPRNARPFNLCYVPHLWSACASPPLSHMHSFCLFVYAILSVHYLVQFMYNRRIDRPVVFLVSLLLTSKTPTVSILSLTFLSHVTNSSLEVLPELAALSPACRKHRTELLG